MFLSGGPKQYKVPLLQYKDYSIYALQFAIEGPELEKCWFWTSVTNLSVRLFTLIIHFLKTSVREKNLGGGGNKI